jgi:hypothetical protein
MGQYYKAVLGEGDMIRVLNPSDFGHFLKIMEHSWIYNDFVNSVYRLILDNPKRVTWIGDYAKSVNYPALKKINKDLPAKSVMNIYHKRAWESTKQKYMVFPVEIPMKEEELLKLLVDETRKKYLINHTKGIYLDVNSYIKKNRKEDDWIINPLPLLTAYGNGLGGGDYFSEIGGKDVGSWAFNILEFSYVKPQGYVEKNYEFYEP